MTIRVLEMLGQSAGGVGRHVAEVVKALDGSDGLTVDVAAPPDLRVRMPKPLIPVAIPSGLRGHMAAVGQLKSVIRAGGYSIVHAHGLRAGIDGAIAARRVGTPAIVTLHNLIKSQISGPMAARIYARLEPVAVRLSAKTFVPSQEIAEHLRRVTGRSADKVEVLYAGVAEPPVASRGRDEVRTELGVELGGSLIVTASRLHAQKALDVLLRAVARLSDETSLAIAGEGPLAAELKELARELGIDKRVTFLGFREDVADYIAAADVFGLSSVWEAVPLAAQEAVLLDVPVVATDVGGLPELIEDGASGRLVPAGDPEALSRALADVIGSPETGRSYAAQARADYGRRFSRDAVLERLRAVYWEHAATR